MSEITDFVAAVVDKVRKSWGWFLATGILVVILGVLCVGKAQIATALSILTLGWILVISAALWLSCALYTFGLDGLSQYLPNPIIRGVVGYVLIRQPNVGAAGVALLLAVLIIVLGTFRALTASVYKYPRWEWFVFSGLVSLCLGAYLLTIWHTASTYVFGVVIAIDLIVEGTALVIFASALHSSPEVQHRAA